MRTLVFALFLALCLAGANAYAQSRDPAEFGRFMIQVHKDPASIDYVAMRRAYIPYALHFGFTDSAADEQAWMQAVTIYGLEMAELQLEKALQRNFVRFKLHAISALLNGRVGNTKRQAFHQLLAERLYRATVNGRDGRSETDAISVVDPVEALDLIEHWKFQPQSKQRLESQGRRYDVWTVTDAKSSNAPFKLYFDVTETAGGK